MTAPADGRMTPAEAWAGWCRMTAEQRRAFGVTLVSNGILSGPESTRLVLAPVTVVHTAKGRLQ